ncbi:HNH endonuclease [Geomonas paludis]|uniref:HNH endonuclease n=1 Tax=Geomonas paludis TaxID=2740185 RepID=A0ABY4LBV9_9BACT|nr:HNH endonuclease [Geomonas paludis]UPU35269.1 HNH endonuclease [Geomonas paludis]
MIDSTEIARIISSQLRVELTGTTRYADGHEVLRLRFNDLPVPNGFSIEFRPSWRRVDGELVLDTYSGSVVDAMGKADAEKRAVFEALALDAIAHGMTLAIAVNDVRVEGAAHLPEPPWQRLKIHCSKLTAARAEGPEALSAEILSVSLIFSTLLLSLLPFEDVSLAEQAGLPEGAKFSVEVNRYERSLVNRAACIAVHGVKCVACGFDFGERYGDVGRGFIEVHHRVPVSKMGSSYVVNPVTDLVPLCSNCHSIAHREDPPIAPEEISRLLHHRQTDI